MDCERAQALAAPFLTDRVEGRLRGELEEHYSTCLICARVLKAQAKLRSAVLETFPEPSSAPEQLKANITFCVRCMEEPGRVACPRLIRKFRLVGLEPEAVR
jgi:hypothetical protein